MLVCLKKGKGIRIYKNTELKKKSQYIKGTGNWSSEVGLGRGNNKKWDCRR